MVRATTATYYRTARTVRIVLSALRALYVSSPSEQGLYKLGAPKALVAAIARKMKTYVASWLRAKMC